MKKVNANIELNDQQLALKENVTEKLLKNELVIRFMNDNQLDDAIVRKYPFRFKTWLDSLSKCTNCKGINDCRQENTGEYFDLKYDGILDLQIERCQYALKEYSKTVHMKYFRYNDLPESLRTVSLEDAVDDDYSPEYFSAYKNVLKWYLNEDKDKGLFLHGDVGVGKSYLAACICNGYARKGKFVSYIHVPTFVNYIRNIMINDNEEYKYLIEKIKESHFVVFDDIGAEALTSFNRDEILLPILDYRMNNKLLSMFTSNEDFDSLHNHFENDNKTINMVETLKADRIMERIKALSSLLKIEGINRRALK